MRRIFLNISISSEVEEFLLKEDIAEKRNLYNNLSQDVKDYLLKFKIIYTFEDKLMVTTIGVLITQQIKMQVERENNCAKKIASF
jgi:hypothetical protein